jgi:hypothetical protein
VRVHVHEVSDCTRFLFRKPITRRGHCLLVLELDRHLGIRPVSQLNNRPAVSPVNASRRPSRDAAHHSGPGWLAMPYPVEDLHLLFFASFPGALAVESFSDVQKCPGDVCSYQ